VLAELVHPCAIADIFCPGSQGSFALLAGKGKTDFFLM
jgi:hypothetical protein